MIYLDYSATTKADKRVLDLFVKDNENFFANPNSIHGSGLESKKSIDAASKEILEILSLEDYEMVYTSGATESNNLAIKGIAYKNDTRKHIISTSFEHSSVVACLNYLSKMGYEVDIVENDEYGLVDLESLKELINENTCLVSIGAVNSETGIVQDLKSISDIVRNNKDTVFHSDMTQAIGKIRIDFSLADLISFSGHKIYGLKGVGGLLVKNKVKLVPIIHGGKSTSPLRAGTPATPLMLSLRNSLKFMYENFDMKLSVIKDNHDYFIEKTLSLPNTVINSNKFSLNQIINVSFLDIPSHKLHHEMSKRNIYISTSTACSSNDEKSLIIERLTGSEVLAETSVRISISHLTTKEEIDQFFTAYKEIV
ncbi:MAG: cysteine desulfurase family protein [Candidatus Izemoplasmatales bacterium]